MPKFLTSFAALLLVALVVLGCGKKEAANESMEMTMPMSVSVDSASAPTNMITKAGTPVDTSASMPEQVDANTAVATTETAGYVAPSPQDIQQALKNAGIYTGAVDGKLGPASKKAITEFQQQNGLTADGKVGKKTWEKLKLHLNQNQQ